ncbi:hypothetical protein [Streptomyces sp. NRRL B-1347]|uniref:hypothetical protein n=1 Tax=Streptomyces sp. NRRL B-1347 TaxID=1476877 RepID=UPI003B63E7CD
MASVAEAYAQGADLDWRALVPGTLVDLPTYAFQHQHYWLVSPEAEPGAEPAVAVDEVEARFWEAVEREDLEQLAAELEVADGSAAELGAVLPVLSSWRWRR